VRLATWNVNSLKARLDRVLAWTERQAPDVLCLQETKLTDAQAPALDFKALGYELVHHGPGGRFLAATCGRLRVATIYVPNGRVVDSDFYLEKLEWLARLAVWLDDNDPSTELAICGDFNVAPEPIDVWDEAAVHGATHVSPRERAAVAKLREWGMVDVVRRFHPEPGFFSWWDYRAGHFHKNFGMRIDHVYVSEPLAARAVAAERDRDARKPSTYPGIPSDHAPLIVDFDLG
jgi:exodeoxyribonuclease III